MGYTINSPRNSFVKFASAEQLNDCCEDQQEFCIPVINENDLVFQIIVTADTAEEFNTLWSAPDNNASLFIVDQPEGNTIVNLESQSLYFQKFRTGEKQITYFWNNPFNGLSAAVSCNQCFYLSFIITEPNPQTVFSNCLIRKCESCYTTVLEYYCSDDYDQFNYCNVTNGFNRVRLPIYLHQPQFIEEAAKYRRSSGDIKVTKSVITKEYQVVTEFFPEHLHEKLKVALSHDHVSVDSESYSGGIYASNNYEIEWNEDMCVAQAKFKATATPYIIRNNNCEECQDFDVPVEPVECPTVTDIIGQFEKVDSQSFKIVINRLIYAVPSVGIVGYSIYYQLPSGSGNWELWGNAGFDPDGYRVVFGPTEPLEIMPLDYPNPADPRGIIDIKFVNDCNGGQSGKSFSYNGF